ncbi:unnamed protein product, partial [Musa acuminata subsp. malaccensis]
YISHLCLHNLNGPKHTCLLRRLKFDRSLASMIPLVSRRIPLFQ